MINREILKFNDVIQAINDSGLIKINVEYEYMERGKIYLLPDLYAMIESANSKLKAANDIISTNEKQLKSYYDLKLKDLYYGGIQDVLDELNVKDDVTDMTRLFDMFTEVYYNAFIDDLKGNLGIDFQSSIISTRGSAFKVKSKFTDSDYVEVDKHTYLLEVANNDEFIILDDITDVDILQINQEKLISNFEKNLNWYYDEFSDYNYFNSSWMVDYINEYINELKSILAYLSGDELINDIKDDMHNALAIIDTIHAYKDDSVSYFKDWYMANIN